MQAKPDYGIDAPTVYRNLWIGAVLCLAIAPFLPPLVHFSTKFELNVRGMLFVTGFFCLAEALLFTLYVKYGKFKHRDFILGMHTWRGDEQVMDVGCGRGLLLAGAAKHLTTGHATGVDVWSNKDMGGNSPDATERNLTIEGVADRCTLVSVDAGNMTFPNASFDVILSNLCLHNIGSSQRACALNHIVRTLKPGGIAIISDYKLTREYAAYFRRADLIVTKRRGSFLTTFPPPLLSPAS